MKAMLFQRLWLVAMVASAGSLTSRANEETPPVGGKVVEVREQPEPEEPPEIEKPPVIEPVEREDRFEIGRGDKFSGFNPGRRGTLPDDVKKLLEDFKSARDQYLERQKELLKVAKDGTEADREKLREQVQELRKDFLDRQRTIREEVKRRLEELRRELPNRQEIIDAAKEKAKDRRGRDGSD
jgi:hypothetical protein